MEFSGFTPIKLEQMDQVKLMNRVDHKYWFHEDKLGRILQSVSQDYYVLDIDGQIEFPYTTTYYDTVENRMYTMHHNKNLNRYKIRHRSYLSSGISFLEIKFKNNKGRTFKKRIPANRNEDFFTAEESDFIHTNTPYSCRDLSPTLINQFSRMTLVNKNFRERCTIDQDLLYTRNASSVKLAHLVIIEIKTNGRESVSPLALALGEERIRASGFSKYCIGRVLTDQNLKRNRFKRKIRRMGKALQTNTDLYNINKTG